MMKRWKVIEREKGVPLPLTDSLWPNLRLAMERAQFQAIKHKGATCDVVNRITGHLRIRYWFDGSRLQYLEY